MLATATSTPTVAHAGTLAVVAAADDEADDGAGDGADEAVAAADEALVVSAA